MKWIYVLAAVAALLLTIREALLLSRGRRARGATGSVPAAPLDARTRIVRKAAWPVFLVLIALVVVLGMAVGVAVGRR